MLTTSVMKSRWRLLISPQYFYWVVCWKERYFLHHQKENRYKRVEQAFGMLPVIGSPVDFGVRNKGLQNR